MKTGTTYLQDLMHANQEMLAAKGYLFPGKRWTAQSRAVREVLFQPSDDVRLLKQTDGAWDRLRTEMLSYRGRASIVSMEFLSFADAEKAGRIVSDLEGADVHVILTIRDAHGAIPAQWQTACRNGARIPLRKFLGGVRHVVDGTEGRGARLFDRTQGIPRMLDVWTPLVGADHVHVITVPPRGSDPALLWNRFASVIGVRPGAVKVDLEASNTSLGHASSELLRLVNRDLGDVPTVDYWRVVKGGLARAILGERAGLEKKVRLNRRGVQMANQWNRRVRQAITERGVDFIGSYDELPIVKVGDDVPKGLPAPTTEELLETANAARLGLVAQHDELVETCIAKAERRHADEMVLPSPIGEVDPATPQAWLDAEAPVDAAVADIIDQLWDCIRVNQLATAGAPLSAEEEEAGLQHQDDGDDGSDDGSDDSSDRESSDSAHADLDATGSASRAG